MNPIEANKCDDRSLEERMEAFGCTEVIRLDQGLNAPEQLDYLDLLPRRSSGATPAPINAVAEHQGVALLYIVDATGDNSVDTAKLARLQQQLANRSDPAWLGIVRPGSLDIFPIGFHETGEWLPVQTIEERDGTAPFFFQSLVHGTFAENKRLRGSDYVFNEIFGLLTQTTNEFVPEDGKGKLAPLEVLSMAGRALFFRFLIDRRIVLATEIGEICPAASELKDAFSTAEKAAQTSAWLDQTFNGDFLQLVDESIPSENRGAREAAYLVFFRRTQHLVGKRIFDHLEAILRGWKAVPGGIQPTLDWDDLDFAHIPVGVLSQVYESFSHRADSTNAKKTSVHYTPRSIANLMLEQSFAALEDKGAAHVLDSSCGAGIFLVLAFRRLVRERWQHDEERPKTRLIQDILYQQLRGFDVSESALRLAALALYITAIELNASPHPPKNLKFPKNLRNTVLHRFGETSAPGEEKSAAFSLGSLGPEVPSHFNKSFDIVIGNPPWTRLREDDAETDEDDEQTAAKVGKSETDKLNDEFTAIGHRVLIARGFDDLAHRYENPDKNPDIPFLWRATEWAKDGGVIAFAMPARLFGRTSGKGFEAWRAVLRSIEVTGLINGADLRWSSVWKDVKMPFCILFARNAIPPTEHRFYYATPINEPKINGLGRLRIDYETTLPISIARLEKQPWILKTLSLGTWLDIEVMETLTNPLLKTLGKRWSEWDIDRLKTGEGFNRAPGSAQKYVDFLAELPVFEIPQDGFKIEYANFHTYGELFGTNKKGEAGANKPRRKVLFQPPLVVVSRAPGDDLTAPRAFISTKALAFSKSYYGYSCDGSPDPETLSSLIFLLAHSTLFRYFALMVSVSIGADRMVLTKQDFDNLPFPDIEKLPKSTRTAIRNLARQLQGDDRKPWVEIDQFVFRLYGLDDDAVQVAQDTLFAAASYRKAGRAALERTIRETRAPFVAHLHASLEPYFEVCGEHVAIREASFQTESWGEPWLFLTISREAEIVSVNTNLLRKAMTVANEHGTSRIIVKAPGRRGLLLGLLNQRRWWTTTRARLCAQHIIRQHLNAFGLPESE